MQTIRFLLLVLLVTFSAVAQQPTAVPLTVAMKVLQEHVTHSEPAVYGAIARAAHVTGDVVVGVELDESGKVTHTVVLSGPEMLRFNAVDAMKKWTFTPVEIDGKPHAVRSAVIFKFKDIATRARTNF